MMYQKHHAGTCLNFLTVQCAVVHSPVYIQCMSGEHTVCTIQCTVYSGVQSSAQQCTVQHTSRAHLMQSWNTAGHIQTQLAYSPNAHLEHSWTHLAHSPNAPLEHSWTHLDYSWNTAGHIWHIAQTHIWDTAGHIWCTVKCTSGHIWCTVQCTLGVQSKGTSHCAMYSPVYVQYIPVYVQCIVHNSVYIQCTPSVQSSVQCILSIVQCTSSV